MTEGGGGRSGIFFLFFYREQHATLVEMYAGVGGVVTLGATVYKGISDGGWVVANCGGMAYEPMNGRFQMYHMQGREGVGF